MAKVKSWITVEVNGWVHLWYHAEGLEPTWTVPEIEEITSGTWTYRARAEHHISAHIQELPENGADILHLKQVHSPFIGAGVDLGNMWGKLWSFGAHEWDAQWEALPPPNHHIGLMHLKHSLKIFGVSLKFAEFNLRAFQTGPGIVHLYFDCLLENGIYQMMVLPPPPPHDDLTPLPPQTGPGIVHLYFDSLLGKGIYQMMVLPEEPLHQKCVFNIFCAWTIPTFVAKLMQMMESMMVERDIMIWNNKRYRNNPMFMRSAADSLIARHRRWYSQFYSENSPKLTFRREGGLEW